MADLREEDVSAFRNFVRMNAEMFRELLLRLGLRFTKNDTWCTKPLDSSLKLAISLRYLATGDSYRTLMYRFRVAHNTISLVVHNVCQAIIEEYVEEVKACPATPEEGQEIAKQFGSSHRGCSRWETYRYQVAKERRVTLYLL